MVSFHLIDWMIDQGPQGWSSYRDIEEGSHQCYFHKDSTQQDSPTHIFLKKNQEKKN